MTRVRYDSGQTVVALLIFMMLAITLTLTATVVVIINTQGGTAYQQSEQARSNAETGVENALLRLERDPSYTGETVSLTDGTATITISGTGPVTITSVGHAGRLTRTITATATISAGIVTLSSWNETP